MNTKRAVRSAPRSAPRRVRHFAVDRLSAEGRAIVRRGMRENWTLLRVVEELREKTGERLSSSALHRWRAAEKAQDLTARMDGAGLDKAMRAIEVLRREVAEHTDELDAARAELARTNTALTKVAASRRLEMKELAAIARQQSKILVSLASLARFFVFPSERN